MRVIILAGGLGTRISEESDTKPKPMIDVGGKPLLWHVMKVYAAQGFDDFVIAAGYKSEVIKRWFYEEAQLSGDLFVDARTGEVIHTRPDAEPWKVRIVNTGLETNTGGRIHRLRPHIGDEPFMVTYGDGVSNVDLASLLAFHKRKGKSATITAVRPPARFGGLLFDGDDLTGFSEKPQTGEGWINGGFAVLEPRCFDMLALKGDETSLEIGLFEDLARAGDIAAWQHEGFWQCVDTLRELRLLQALWASGKAPWKLWEDRPWSNTSRRAVSAA
jgi:glucose-1-phosphate cytidylyltransferase